MKFLDFNKSCRKIVQAALNTDPNSRYNVLTIKEENEIQPKKWKIISTNEKEFLVEVERVGENKFKFFGEKKLVDFVVGLIKFNFRSALDLDEGKLV